MLKLVSGNNMSKNMSKYLEVKACCDCPFNKSNEYNGHERCSLTQRMITRDDMVKSDELGSYGSFPSWCPLKDKEQL